MKKSASAIIWGIVIILLGVALILNATGVVKSLLFDGWWTVFLIVPGLALVFKKGARTFGAIVLLLGIYFLLKVQNVIMFELSWLIIVGVVLVIVGIQTLVSRGHKANVSFSYSSDKQPVEGEPVRVDGCDYSDKPDYTAIFSGVDARNACKALSHCEATGIFGGVRLDLRDAVPVDGAKLDLTGVFGSVEVALPTNARYNIETTQIFGSVQNGVAQNEDTSLPLVHVDASGVFGGVKLF